MNITLLLQSFAGLVALLALLMFFLLYNFKTKKLVLKKDTKMPNPKEQKQISLVSLRKKLRNSKTTAKELVETLDLILKYHGEIHPKIGTKMHPDFDNYAEILFTIARHKHVNKAIILNFDKELEKRNPSYKKEINNALMRGLNSRGV
jgi:hypothetical protein